MHFHKMTYFFNLNNPFNYKMKESGLKKQDF